MGSVVTVDSILDGGNDIGDVFPVAGVVHSWTIPYIYSYFAADRCNFHGSSFPLAPHVGTHPGHPGYRPVRRSPGSEACCAEREKENRARERMEGPGRIRDEELGFKGAADPCARQCLRRELYTTGRCTVMGQGRRWQTSRATFGCS